MTITIPITITNNINNNDNINDSDNVQVRSHQLWGQHSPKAFVHCLDPDGVDNDKLEQLTITIIITTTTTTTTTTTITITITITILLLLIVDTKHLNSLIRVPAAVRSGICAQNTSTQTSFGSNPKLIRAKMTELRTVTINVNSDGEINNDSDNDSDNPQATMAVTSTESLVRQPLAKSRAR